MTSYPSKLEISWKRGIIEGLVSKQQWQLALPLAVALADNSSNDCITLASIYGALGMEEQVVKTINDCNNRWPEDPIPTIWLATHHLDLGLLHTAYETLGHLDPREDGLGFYYYSIESRIFKDLYDYDSALKSAVLASSLAPDAEKKEDMECSIALLYFLLNRYKSGFNKLKTILEINPASQKAAGLSIKYMMSTCKWNELVALLLKIENYHVANHKNNISIVEAQVTCYLELRDYQTAEEGVRELIRLKGDEDIFVNKCLQRLDVANQQYERNKQKLESLIALDAPNDG